MKIVIPSYNRQDTINSNTLKVLRDNNILNKDIYVFVSSTEQFIEYKKVVDDDINIIVGELGIKNQRNFISNYFEIDEILISMDDDINEIKIKGDKTLLQILDELVINCDGLTGFQPTFNEYFSFNNNEIQYGLYFCVGCFFIYRNRHSILTNDYLHDYELSIKYFIADGHVTRYNHLIFKTKYWNQKGGISTSRTIDTYYSNINKLIFKYNDYCSYGFKKVKYFNKDIPNIRLKYKMKGDIILLPKLYDGFFDILNNMLVKILLPYKSGNSGRVGFPKYRGSIFGLSKGIKNATIGLSRSSIQYPSIWEEILRIGDLIVPFPWTSCFINNNTICPPHKDANNIGKSMLVSFGDYTGCKIVINEKEYDANYSPIIFDGAKLLHYNTNDLIGNKYSLIFYNKK
jgi:hypothetical protein